MDWTVLVVQGESRLRERMEDQGGAGPDEVLLRKRLSQPSWNPSRGADRGGQEPINGELAAYTAQGFGGRHHKVERERNANGCSASTWTTATGGKMRGARVLKWRSLQRPPHWAK